jgi:two-component system LytT family response regulator
VIVDDEPLARERLRELLGQRRDVVIAGEAGDGEEALRLVARTTPDLLFLDVQMPGLDGFEVVAELDGARMPAMVFVTAYDEYAVRAFEVQALDYLVKPFHPARLEETMNRALARRGSPDGGALHAIAAELQPHRGPLTRFVVRHSGEFSFVRPADVSWIEASGNYVRLHTPTGQHLVRTSITDVGERLDPALFLRVHRRAIVNVDAIKKLEPYFHGEFVITMNDGSQVTSSRNFSGGLRGLVRNE